MPECYSSRTPLPSALGLHRVIGLAQDPGFGRRRLVCAAVVRKLGLIVAILLLSGTAVLARHGHATAYAAADHRCPSVPTLYAFKRGPALRIIARGVSCAEALGIVRAMTSGVGVAFVGNPNGPASQFRWKLYGFPGWTCFGDGSGFPEGGAGGDCAKGPAGIEWWHAN